jgi:hypothetical protein
MLFCAIVSLVVSMLSFSVLLRITANQVKADRNALKRTQAILETLGQKDHVARPSSAGSPR